MIIILFIVVYFVIGSIIFKGFAPFLTAQKYLPRAVVVGAKDFFLYIKNKDYKKFNMSGIIMYGGLFGTGKTFNIVNFVCSVYKAYDNIEVYSNVTLNNVPYTPFLYFEQITEPVEEGKHRIYICDEFGSLFNSRNYGNSKLTEAQYLTALNQLRKEKKLLLISTQRYGMCDKIFRQVCMEWRECHKLWRFMWYYRYDPYDLEYSYDPRIVQPLSIFPTMVFATNKKRNQYNTHEFVKGFDNPITITDRADDSSFTKADFGYGSKSKPRYVRRSNKK